MSILENITYDEIELGQSTSYTKTLTEQDIQLFAAASGDINPVHLDDEFAKNTPFKARIAHGMLTGSLFSAALALKLPGPGTIYRGQTLKFTRPVKLGDTVKVNLKVIDKRDDKKIVTLECSAENQNGKTVAVGTAEVTAPTQKVSVPAPQLPSITVG